MTPIVLNPNGDEKVLLLDEGSLIAKAMMDKFPKVFTKSLGLLKHYDHSIVLKKNTVPKIHKARMIPILIREEVEVVEVFRNVVRLKDGKVWNLKRVALCGKKGEEMKQCDHKNYVWLEVEAMDGKLDVEKEQLELMEMNDEEQLKTRAVRQTRKVNIMDVGGKMRNSDDICNGEVVQEELEEGKELVEGEWDVGFKRKSFTRIVKGLCDVMEIYVVCSFQSIEEGDVLYYVLSRILLGDIVGVRFYR
ncbi:hypothetical protein NDU88_001978 [Pleurodeles waltl]|uniref:Uncharacterized protein n=1 Tax=Pleurodeles waltl TaxID=8319 RepID=A0AAV7Q5H7_PLEWA|nr:hypothetical protein NDU88_001978 [Pleurodeles waltl]